MADTAVQSDQSAVIMAEIQARITEAEARLTAAQAAATATLGASTKARAVRPADPLMGTTEETFPGSNNFYYAFGGKPKGDWSGIEDLNSRLITDASCRPTDRVTGQKGTKARK